MLHGTLHQENTIFQVFLVTTEIESDLFSRISEQKLLSELGFKISMGGKGNCYDNAAVETFFKTLNAELVWRHTWSTHIQVTEEQPG